MAQSFLNTGTQLGNFEDLVNFIYRISYDQAPFMNAIGTVKAKAIKHEWMTQALRAAAANAQAEGYTPSYAASNQTVRVRRDNQVQIIADELSVSYTQEYVDKAGLGSSSEYEEQKDLRMLEISKDADLALLTNTKVTRDGDAGTAGQMDGALAWASGTLAKAAGGSALTQDLFEELSRAVWVLSGQTVDTIVCNGFQRRQISTWTTNFKEHMSKDTTLTDTVETYRGDWGTQVVLPDPHMTESAILAFRKEYVKKAYLRPLAHYELGQTIDGRRGYVVTEVTLEVRNPNTVAKITGLAV
jgi:hypothetical protein